VGKIATGDSLATSRSLAAHKLRGPKGIGALILREGESVPPLLRGGAQERGIRPGRWIPWLPPVSRSPHVTRSGAPSDTAPWQLFATSSKADSVVRSRACPSMGRGARSARNEPLVPRMGRARALGGSRSRRAVRVERKRVQRRNERAVPSHRGHARGRTRAASSPFLDRRDDNPGDGP